MSPRGKSAALWRWFVSARVTIALLALVAVLLFLNVSLPQEAVVGEERFDEIVQRSTVSHFLLVGMGMGNMATSPVFVTVLALFLLNLAAVLVARVGPTWRRVAMRPRSEEGLRAWARMEETFTAPLPPDWSHAAILRILRGYGYSTRKAGERIFWGVKHRTAPLGFLLFHLSFFLLFGGGVLIYYTRFVGTAILSEGQAFAGAYSEIVREAPVRIGPPLAFVVDTVDTRLEGGEPVHLSARLLFQQAGPPVPQVSRVNHPARWGPAIVLAEQAGIAPVLWLQDGAGFTLDRVVAPARTRGGRPTDLELAEGEVLLRIHPLEDSEPFPVRETLPSTRFRAQLYADGEEVWSGRIGPGAPAAFPGGRLVVEEIRYWVGVRVVSERGGGLLIAGFAAAVLGLVWRLLWYRREVVVDWDDERFRLVGRSEYFSERFQAELRAVHSMLCEPEASDSGKSAADEESAA